MIFTKILLIANILLHVKPIAVLHNNKNTERRLENIITLSHILIITSFQYINFSFNQLHQFLIPIHILLGDYFNCNLFLCLFIYCQVYNRRSTWPKFHTNHILFYFGIENFLVIYLFLHLYDYYIICSHLIFFIFLPVLCYLFQILGIFVMSATESTNK